MPFAAAWSSDHRTNIWPGSNSGCSTTGVTGAGLNEGAENVGAVPVVGASGGAGVIALVEPAGKVDAAGAGAGAGVGVGVGVGVGLGELLPIKAFNTLKATLLTELPSLASTISNESSLAKLVNSGLSAILAIVIICIIKK